MMHIIYDNNGLVLVTKQSKPALGASDKAILKPVSSATETN